MAERVDLAEALRRILEDSEDGETEEEQKENVGEVLCRDPTLKFGSPRDPSHSCLKPINRALSYVKTDAAGTGASPSLDRRRKAGPADDPSPPKKRRHANHVIILRPPRSKTKAPVPSAEQPAGKTVKTEPRDSQPPSVPATGRIQSGGLEGGFTVELETGVAGQIDSMPAPASSSSEAALSAAAMRGYSLPPTGQWPGVGDLSSPPSRRPVHARAPSSSEKRLEAAIDRQICRGASEEELASGLTVLEALDTNGDSSAANFFDASQPQLDGSQVIVWPTGQEEAFPMPTNQQLLPCGGQFFSGICQPPFQGDGNPGQWLARGGSADESLTNITWLKRMSAPDLDPNTLQTAQMMDPRFERPPYSYSLLIQFAISGSRSGKMTLREIYAWIEDSFPYFKTAKAGWRNSIRHNLSLHKIFVREPPLAHGQPAFWTLQSGTVVRLPERRMYVADPENGGTLLQEVAPPSALLPSSSSSSSSVGGALPRARPYLVGGALPHVVMMPGATGAMPSGKSNDGSGCGPRTKKPPLILPRGSQPYALVPVPLLVPPGQTGGGGQTPAGERAPAVPHILSPILMGGAGRFAPNVAARTVGGRKVVPIAPKIRAGDATATSAPTATATAVGLSNSSSSSSSSACNTSSGSDSGVDLSAAEPAPPAGAAAATPNRDLPFKKRAQAGACRSSLPKIVEDNGEESASAEDSFTAFFEQELASPPRGPRPARALPVISTPCKAGAAAGGTGAAGAAGGSPLLQAWFSPLRGFTPFKSPLALDPDSGIYHELEEDVQFSVTLTPNFKGASSRRAASARGPRSGVGSLGDLGLPGLTPEKGGHPLAGPDSVHNQSFGQIFGDLGTLDMDTEGLDVGNLSWTMFSPNKHSST